MRSHTSELRDFVRGSLTIDCVEIELVSNGPDSVVYRGPGSIWQTDDGRLTLKLYCSNQVGYAEIQKAVGSYTTGEIVPDSAFFSLLAVDIKGQSWSGARILPSFSRGEKGTVISADLQDLSTEAELPYTASPARMLLGFDQCVDFPSNATTEVETTVAGEPYGTSASLNVARFSACGYEFTLQDEEGWLVLELLSSGDIFPNSLDIRVSEALQFVLAQHLIWSFREVDEGNKRLTAFRPSGRLETDQRPRRPIALQRIDNTGSTWSLFDKYLHHIIDYDKQDKLHPLSALVRFVVSATFSALESQALAISVAVEGVLRLEFERFGLPSNEIEEEIKAVRKLIQGHCALTEAFKKRVCGFLGNMLRPRAKDRLRELVEEGLIAPELLSAWEDTRHPAAHAGFISASSSPDYATQLISLCLKVNQLFNNLVFLAIGYTGKYTDYSVRGWPLKDFERAIHTDD